MVISSELLHSNHPLRLRANYHREKAPHFIFSMECIWAYLFSAIKIKMSQNSKFPWLSHSSHCASQVSQTSDLAHWSSKSELPVINERFLGMSIILTVILKPNWAYCYVLMVVLAGQGSTNQDVQPRSGLSRIPITGYSIYAFQCSRAWIRPILYIFAALLWICAWNLQE